MPLIILGLLVVAGLLAYLHFSKTSPEEIEEVKPKKKKEEPKKNDNDPAKVIVLPTDIEKEKKKRNIKTDR